MGGCFSSHHKTANQAFSYATIINSNNFMEAHERKSSFSFFFWINLLVGVWRILIHVNRSSHQRWSVKKRFLKISQNSQENTYARVSLLITDYNFIKKRNSGTTFGWTHLVNLRRTLRSETIFGIGKPFKNDENCFYFVLKARFVLKIFKFFSWLFYHGEKRLDQKDKINF